MLSDPSVLGSDKNEYQKRSQLSVYLLNLSIPKMETREVK